jgi:MFS family permease
MDASTPGTPEPTTYALATPAQRRVVVAFLGSTILGTLAASMIWGIATLYQLASGLDILGVMIQGTAFTVTQVLFEVPTGVLADTVGRKVSYLVSIVILIISTLLFLAAGRYHWGLPGFCAAASLLAIGWTFQTGTIDAWLVDALDHTGWVGSKENVFAWSGVAYEGSILVGTVIGGFLGQGDLALPFVVRAALLTVCFVFVAVMVKDLGFERRPVAPHRIGHEMSRILRDGVRHGWRHRVVRPLLFDALLAGAFWMYGSTALQPLLLDVLGRQLVWVAAVGTAVGSLAGIVGNASASRVMQGPHGRRRPGRVMALMSALAALAVLGIGIVGLAVHPVDRGVLPLAVIVALWIASSLAYGVMTPVRRSFLNEHVPSSHRATVLSVDALFWDVGGSGGQPALGWLSRAFSIPIAWVAGSVLLAVGTWPFLAADRAAQSLTHRKADKAERRY